MKQRAARAALLCVEVIAVLVAAGAGAAALVYLRLQQGPVSLGFFEPSLSFAIERRLPDAYRVDIEDVFLVQRGRDVRLSLLGLEILDSAGRAVAAAETIEFSFRTGQVLSGSIGPREVFATGARFQIVRNRSQALKIPAARGRGGRSLFPSSQGTLEQRFLRSAFERAEMRNAVVTFVDEASGRSWTSDNGAIILERTDSGLVGALSGDIDIGETQAAIGVSAEFNEASGLIALDVNGENFPVADLFTTFFGAAAGVIDAPVSGAASIELSRDGEVRRSQFDAAIGEGVLTLGAVSAPIRAIDWKTGFEPAANRFTIDALRYDVGGNRGELSGVVSLEFGDSLRQPRRVDFDLTGADLVVNAPGRLAAPLDVAAAQATGVYEIPSRRLQLDRVALSAVDVDIAGDGALRLAPRDADGARLSPGIDAALAVEGSLDPERLLRLWPLGVGMGARDWVEARLDAAEISNIRAAVNLAPGAIGADGAMPDDALTATFDVAKGKAHYVLGMTPLTEASGSGVLRGNSFLLKAERGRVGSVAIRNGEVEIPFFSPKWQDAFFRFTADGRSQDILGVLDEAPLNLLSKISLSPDQFRGDATVRIEITRPNKRDVPQEDYRYNGQAAFSDMTISGLAGDAELTGAHGEVRLRPRSLTVNASGELAEAPIDIVWKKNFYSQDGPSEISFSGKLDANVADLFGLSLRQYVRGPVDMTARATGNLGDFRSLSVNADFTNAAMSLDLLGWRKPAGAPVSGDIELSFADGDLAIDRFALSGDSVDIAGALSFRSGLLDAAAFPTFRLADSADAVLTAERAGNGALALTVTGPYLNAGPALLRFTKGARPPERNEPDDDIWGRGLKLTARLDTLELRKGVSCRDASFDLRRDSVDLQALSFSALHENGAPLTVTQTLLGDETGPDHLIEVRSGDLGQFLQGVTGLAAVNGGEGSMAIRFGGDHAPGLVGEVEARGMHIVNAPLLARVFSAGSLDGLANLLQGEGIDLSYAYGQFSFRDELLQVREFRATGPSVGMTAEGKVSLAPEGAISMHGAVAPVYQLNSAIGAAPIIGDILVGRKGEGILALSYFVNGARAEPDVLVNPLSALTPGVFRQLFEAGRAPAPDGEAAQDEDPN